MLSPLLPKMDERFNNAAKLPYGWFAKDWKVDSTGVAKKGKEQKAQQQTTQQQTTENDSTQTQMPTFNMEDLMGGGSSYNPYHRPRRHP